MLVEARMTEEEYKQIKHEYNNREITYHANRLSHFQQHLVLLFIRWLSIRDKIRAWRFRMGM
jgi:hypothetical protein